jgi:DNA-binding response OmpR family regulator
MAYKTILLADNDLVFLTTCSEFLESVGFQVIKAASPLEARDILETRYVHLAILDFRLKNDEEKDRSGLLLAKEVARSVPKLILTKFPAHEDVSEAMRWDTGNLPPAVDYVDKRKDLSVLLEAVNRAFTKYVHINLNLAIEWKGRDQFGLVKLIEPGLEGEQLLNNVEEFEDLFRRMFYEKVHIRIDRLLWKRNNRVALVVFAFKEGMKPESFVVVCGQNNIINDEANRFNEFAPRALGKTSTMLGEEMRVETTHFAANVYTLAGNDLENVQTLAELYQLGPDKMFNAALNTLYGNTLKAWHQEKLIPEKGLTLDTAYRECLQLTDDFAQQIFEERIEALEIQIPKIGARFERSEETLVVHFNGQTITYPNPAFFISKMIGTRQSVLLITVPGMLSGHNILTDEFGHTWLTDFAEAGLAPLLWNYVTLEAAIRFDWQETKELQRWHELENCLIFTDFTRPNIGDLEQVVRKPARAIQAIRKLAARTVARDIANYHLGIFFHATRRLADFDPTYPLTSGELARLGHVLLSMAMIAGRFDINKAGKPLTATLPDIEISLVDEKARIVMIGDRKERLAPRPFEVFWYLYQHVDDVCNKEDLLEIALKGKYEERYLHTLIGRIRKAIEDDPGKPRYLITEPNAGYRLISKPE